ncbi:MAG: glutamate--tRNA ligase [Saprospiraceae bacterium]|nr:glutamate--tRNA ligase [Saprospiraceae bacterium]
MPDSVRLRFAPSPTGALHIGGIRTALYNYLLARKLGGRFILRIEDTDRTRYVEGAEDYIVRSLEWLGLFPDESPQCGGPFGPYRQSERMHIYREHAEQLVAAGKAYYAFDMPEAIEHLRSQGNRQYDATTRMSMVNSLTMTASELAEAQQQQRPHVIRLLVTEGEKVIIRDIIRGEVQFDTSTLDDKVLIKSDGMPTYHMANVVDDRLMQITHVIRGEEWLPSTAHHALLYAAFGWEDQMPAFAHLPLILKPTGNGKLSKRDGVQFGFPVFPIDWQQPDGTRFPGFREWGFEPEAMINFLALLGWNPGTDQEVFSLEELIGAFSLEKIVKSGARFDFEKCKWFNQQCLLHADAATLCHRIERDFAQRGFELTEAQAETIVQLYRERVVYFKDFFEQAAGYFLPAVQCDAGYIEKRFRSGWVPLLVQLQVGAAAWANWDPATLEGKVKEFAGQAGIKPGEFFPLLRVVMVGSPNGPDLFRMIAFMGKERFLLRIAQFIESHKDLQAG